MERTNVTRIVAVTLLVVLLVMALIAACARPAPAPAPAPAAKADLLAEIIAGAKKERQVVVMAGTGYESAKLVQLLTKNIKEKYGVDLEPKIMAAAGEGQLLATMTMEYRTGAVPTYDLVNLQAQYIAGGMEAGVLEKVDWKPLLEPGTPPGTLPANPKLFGSIAYNSLTNGLLFNPRKISAAEVPKTLSDLADPKWRGRLGIFNYAGQWAVQAFVRGNGKDKESTFSHLRSIMKNKPLVGPHTDLTSRYLLGEIDLYMTSSRYQVYVREKGAPGDFQVLDSLLSQDNCFVIPKGAQHPNAAKLFALYLSSKDGAMFTWEQMGRSNLYYPGNDLYEVLAQTKKQGLPVYQMETFPGLVDFVSSPAFDQWSKEIELILKEGSSIILTFPLDGEGTRDDSNRDFS